MILIMLLSTNAIYHFNMNKKHLGTVTGGKFIPNNAILFKADFYKHEGKEVDVTVSRHRAKRSDNQNRYLWGVVYKLISETTGYTCEESHEAMKMLFLRVNRDGLPDTVKSTAALSTSDFEEYAENIRRWASVEINCYIPLPNEVDY